MRNWKSITLWTVSAPLAALFLAAGISKWASAEALQAFAGWGYPVWFARLVGVIEITAGVLLLWPRTAWRAAGVLVVVMAGAVATHLYAGQSAQSILPALLAMVLVVLGYCRHPRATLRARLEAAVDWVAERELAQYQGRRINPKAPRFMARSSLSSIQSPGLVHRS
jgi:putative oxidoreductase